MNVGVPSGATGTIAIEQPADDLSLAAIDEQADSSLDIARACGAVLAAVSSSAGLEEAHDSTRAAAAAASGVCSLMHSDHLASSLETDAASDLAEISAMMLAVPSAALVGDGIGQSALDDPIDSVDALLSRET